MNKHILAALGLTVGIAFLGACGDTNDSNPGNNNMNNSVPAMNGTDTSTTIMTGASGG